MHGVPETTDPCNHVVMTVSRKCQVCRTWQIVTGDGKISPHAAADGAQCAGSRPTLRLDQNHAPYSKQWVQCDTCEMGVPITIYGSIAPHRVINPDEPDASAPNNARLNCRGSGVTVPEHVLTFEVAQPPIRLTVEKPARAPKRNMKCPRCGVSVTVRGDDPIPAHQRPSSRWCAEGLKPTELQRIRAQGKRRRKGSVWSVGGGLPTLGQGR